MDAAAKGDYATAEQHVSRAAERVPGSSTYVSHTHYLRGLHLMKKRQYRAAVHELELVSEVYASDSYFQTMYKIARLNDAWFAYDYPGYLARAEELYAHQPDDPQAVLSIAAGNAYRFAQTGEEHFRRKSETFLARLATMEREPSLDERIARVRRCLETRVITPH